MNFIETKNRLREESQEFGKGHYRDEVSRYFPDGLKRVYLNALEKEKADLFVQDLKNTRRWENDGGAYLKPLSFKENLLEHVTYLLNWLNEIEADYPGLFREIFDQEKIMGPDELRIALTIHDIGEIVATDLGAANPAHQNGEAEKHKIKESRAAKMLIHKHLGWKIAREVVKLYEFYEEKRRDHKPSMLGQVLDKGHGSNTFGRIFLPCNVNNPQFDMKARAVFANDLPLNYAQSLAENLSKDSAEQLREMLRAKILQVFIDFQDPLWQEGMEIVKKKYPFFFQK